MNLQNPDYVRTILERVIPFCDLKTLVRLTGVCRWARTYINKNFYIRDALEKDSRGTSHHKYKCPWCFGSVFPCEYCDACSACYFKNMLYSQVINFTSSEEIYNRRTGTRICYG